MGRRCTRSVLGAVLPLLFMGCTGSIGSELADEPRPAATPEPGGETGAGPGGETRAAPLPVRLLSRAEYNNTIRDLLGDGSNAANGFPAESAADTGFAKVQTLDDVNVGAYLDAADAIAGRATADLPRLLGCNPAGSAEDACISSFVTAFGRRAYRRPLTAAEVTDHMTLYRTKLRTELRLATREAAQGLLAAMLHSPYFLYRWELGWRPGAAGDGVLRLNPHHMASQLSYFLWASMPDQDLFSAADRDALRTPAQVAEQVRRMLKDPRAEQTIASFHEQWLRMDSLPGVLRNRGLYPRWNAALGDAMVEEVRRFASDVILRRDGKLETLLTSSASFVDERLAPLYGITGVTGGFQPRALPATERAGLLTLAGVMAAHADENEPSPILRGQFVREHVMCSHIPPPPGMIPDLPPPEENVPKKDRFAMHSAGSCKGCHVLMDPIGFGFENYDAIGAYRTMDGRFPVDTTGVVTALDGQDRPFTNALEMVELLARSDQVRACVVKQWFRYAIGRRETEADDQAIAGVRDAFQRADYDLRELLVALASSRAFMYRAAGAGEELTR